MLCLFCLLSVEKLVLLILKVTVTKVTEGYIWSFVPLGSGAVWHGISFQHFHAGFNRGPTHREAH